MGGFLENNQQAYKTLTQDGVEYIEKEAFHDAMQAAQTIIQDHVYIMKRMEGRHADGRMALYGDAYKRLFGTIVAWETFKANVMGEDLEKVLEGVDDEKEKVTNLISLG
jgi:hypothetical protein